MAFALSKLLWVVVSPGNLLVFLLASGLLMATMPCPRCVRLGRILSSFAALCLVIIAVFPVGDWALTPLENRFTFQAPDQIDGIIVIGGDEKTEISAARGMPVALDSMRRYVTFADMARRYPDAGLVFSGGSAFPRARISMQDADVARDVLADIGVPVDRMIFEKTSRNTYENAVFTADIVRPEPGQKWLLVTSAWHMTRAMGCFRKAGWNIYPAPTGYFTTGTYKLRPLFRFEEQMDRLTYAMHEYVGLIAYHFLGRTSALWPG